MVLTFQQRRRLQEARRSRAAAAARPASRRSMFSRIAELIDGPAWRSLLLRRASANGLEREELDLASRQVGSLSQLPRLLDSVAKELENRARYWAELGLQPRARDHYLNAALWA